MKPICLNEVGDTICESCTHGVAIREEWGLASFVGKHQHCGGEISIVRISAEGCQSVNCASCGRLAVVPSNVNTMGRLRAHVRGVKNSRRRRC